MAQQQADSRVLEAAKTAWAQGEADRRSAAAQLEEARSEAAKVKVWALPSQACLTMNVTPDHGHLKESGLLHLPLKNHLHWVVDATIVRMPRRGEVLHNMQYDAWLICERAIVINRAAL